MKNLEITRQEKGGVLMKKRFGLWILVLCMLLTMSMGLAVPAFADGNVGDEYHLDPEGYPKQHWVYMSDEQIDSYLSAGWEMYAGTLWIGPNDEVVEFQQVKTSEIQELYNQGYKVVAYYTWRHDGVSLGKNQEQSVSVGVWKYSPDQAIEYYRTFVRPEIITNKMRPEVFYLSQWFYDGFIYSEPDGSETDEELAKLNFVRYQFDMYKFGYGSQLFLKNGEYDAFSYQEAQNINETVGFQNEMPAWGASER